MTTGKMTVSDLRIELSADYEHILDIRIESRENEHARMTVLLEMPEEFQAAQTVV